MRFVVHTPSVTPLASFDSRKRAEEYREFILGTDYSMELEIRDDEAELAKAKDREAGARKLSEAIRLLMEPGEPR